MSRVNLTTYFLYKKKLPSSVTLPTHPQLAFPRVSFPKRGVTCLYGTKGTVDVLQKANELAEEKGKQICAAELDVEIGQWMRGKLSLKSEEKDKKKKEKSPEDPPKKSKEEALPESLDNTVFLNTSRIKADLANHISKLWQGYCSEENIQDNAFPREPTQYPHLIERLWMEPEFNHLSVIAYRADTAFSIVQFATLFDPEVESIFLVADKPIDASLPDVFETVEV